MYTVKHAAAMTGVPADTLRMWERRYSVVTPPRSAGGYRLYDDAAIARLSAMHALVEAGWAPRRAAVQVASGTTLGPTGEVDAGPVEAGNPTGHDQDLDLFVRLALEFDADTLTRALDDVFARRDLEEVADSWLMPALARLGQAWRRGEISVAAEHFVSAGVQRRLSAALDAVPPRPGAPSVLVGLGRGSRHELGVLAFAALLARAGLDVMYVGGDVPPDSWVVAVETCEPDAVVLAVPGTEDMPVVRDTVAALAAARPDLSVYLGGRHQEDAGVGQPLGHSLAAASEKLAERLSR
jgi:MerR family transcriptional regulator, light-induced transcriptional regulator